MKKIVALIVSLLLAFPALAQQGIQLAPGQLLANDTAAERPGRAANISAYLDRALTAAQGSILYRGVGGVGWIASRNPVLGVPGTITGTMGFAGATSGTATIVSQPVAGTPTITLPTTSGTMAVGASAPLSLNATTGALTITGSALTKTDDTNVTVTLGGTPASALLAGTSLTMGWTGTLSMARGGNGAALTAANGAIPYSTASSMALLAATATGRLPLLSGANAAPVWGAYTLPATVTSGGVACFTSATVQGSSVALTANAIMLGGGAGACPSPMASLGTTTTVLHGNAAGAPTFGAVANADLATAADGTIKSNISGGVASPSDNTITAVLDKLLGTTQGAIAYRNASTWTAIAPGANGTVLTSGGPAANPSFTPVSGTGTVTSVATTDGLGGGPITTSGTISLASTPPGGRLTLTSGVCITTSNVAAATTMYYAPCGSAYIPIYNGTRVQVYNFTSSATDAVGLSAVMGSNWAAATNYDWYVGLNGSTVTLCSGPAWTSNVARGTGAGTTELQLYGGMWTNKNSITCRYSNAATFTCPANQCTYVGAMRTVAAGQTDDTTANRFVSNAYNAQPRTLRRNEAFTSWAYSTAAWTYANSNTANKVSVLMGLPGSRIRLVVMDIVATSGATSRIAYAGVGVNTNTVNSANLTPYGSTTSTFAANPTAYYDDYALLGATDYNWIEYGGGADVQTWYSNAGVSQPGMTGEVMN